MENLHSLKRCLMRWGSFGKLHNEPLKWRHIKDLSDSHLMHIIEWIKMHPDVYDKDTLDFMITESKYRTENYIFVPEYE